MSFVYAEKLDNTIDIHCDTKTGLDDLALASYSPEQMVLIQKYGIVKTTVVCPEISISFAGNNVYLASELFRHLYEKMSFTTQEVVEIAYDIHKTGDINDVEFIIASCEEDVLSLYCIKEHEIQNDCQFAWIGSTVAHRQFQECRLRNNKGRASERTGMAFLEVVQGCSDQSVGGFHIIAGYNPTEKSMVYRESLTLQNGKPQTVQPGEAIRFFTDAENGNFSYRQVPVSLEDMILMIDQMEPAILYSRRLRMSEKDRNNPQLFSFMLPMLIREDGKGGWVRC